jgi:hypothetical protein
MRVSSIITNRNHVTYYTVDEDKNMSMVKVWHDGTTKRDLLVSDDTMTLIILLHRYFYACSDV